jgi:hypothetical protein
LLNKITVQVREKSFVFPCFKYGWLKSDIVRWIFEVEEIREGTSFLPQNEPSAVTAKQRAQALERKRALYQFNDSLKGFPSSIKAKYLNLPVRCEWVLTKQLDERWTDEKEHDFITARNRIVKDALLDKFFHSSAKVDHFSGYEDFFKFLPKPELRKTWKTDKQFGIQVNFWASYHSEAARSWFDSFERLCWIWHSQ